MNPRPTDPTPFQRCALRSLRAVCWVAATFTVVVLVLMLINYLQLETADPFHSDALEALIKASHAAPDNAELKEQVRALDQLGRRAFFGSRAFNRMGALLLLLGSLVTMLSLKLIDTLSKQPAPPARHSEPANQTVADRRARLSVGLMAGLVAALALFLLIPPRVDQPLLAQEEVTPLKRMDWDTYSQQWPRFRGANGIGLAHPDASPPLSWDGESGENIRWKVGVPLSAFNSPIVWSNRVFMTGSDLDTLEVYAFDSDSGELVWQREVASGAGPADAWPEVGEDTGYSAPTAATDGERVYAIFATGDVAAFDFEGNPLWTRHLGTPENPYGYASSLSTYNMRVLIQYDQSDSARVLALDGLTGKTVWETVRDVKASWTTPILIQSDEQVDAQWITHADPFVIAYDPDTGIEKWRLKCIEGSEIAPSLAYDSSKRIFAASDYPFITMILNEAAHALSWTYEDELPDVCSPLATGEHVLMAASYGVLTCLDAASGEVAWQEELPNEIYASPVLAGGRIYLMDKSGLMHILQPGAEYKVLATAKLGEASVCTAAFVGKRIYIRGAEHLYCVEADE